MELPILGSPWNEETESLGELDAIQVAHIEWHGLKALWNGFVDVLWQRAALPHEDEGVNEVPLDDDQDKKGMEYVCRRIGSATWRLRPDRGLISIAQDP